MRKRQRGGVSSQGAWRRMGERGPACVEESEIQGAGGQAMGVQLKVHTLAKIWVLSRQSSRRPLQGTHHTKAERLKIRWAPLTDGLRRSRRYRSPLLGLSQPLLVLFLHFIIIFLLDSLLGCCYGRVFDLILSIWTKFFLF